jgi:hypothetical protein
MADETLSPSERNIDVRIEHYLETLADMLDDGLAAHSRATREGAKLRANRERVGRRAAVGCAARGHLRARGRPSPEGRRGARFRAVDASAALMK